MLYRLVNLALKGVEFDVSGFLKVSGVDLRDASHEEAVEAIRRAGDSVVLLVRSGQDRCQVNKLNNTLFKKCVNSGFRYSNSSL